jgi:dTDP-4-dehydrorhamnose reductase
VQPKIALFGVSGQVGYELHRALAPVGLVNVLSRAQANFADSDAVVRVLDEVRPQVVVIAAAYTAVDKAESEAGLCEQINAITPERIGRWSFDKKALIVYYSTDYVFDGDKPQSEAYSEDDPAKPQGTYGRSKLAGEQAVRASGAEHLILRTSWVLGAHGSNFAKTMLRLARERDSLRVVADQWGAPTSAALIADVTAHMLRARLTGQGEGGIYHLTADGQTNWCDYAHFVLARAAERGMRLRVQPDAIEAIATKDYPTPAKRPANSRLSTAKLRDTFGLHLPPWQDGVARVVDTLLQQHALSC